jgi:predicted nucleic acid-binding protein
VLYDRVVVPRIVFEEVTVAGEGLIGAGEVASAGWLEVVDRTADPDLLRALDAGEAAAIPLAQELGAVLLVDDGTARAVAAERGIAVVGSLGVLIAAKRRGHLEAVEPVLDRMMLLGMFVAPALRAHVLALAGESGAEGV